MKKETTLVFLIVLILFIGCKSEENNSSNVSKNITSLLNEIVVELKSPKKISLTPRTFIELNAIIIASNYFWTEELMKSNTNISSEALEEYKNQKKQQLLSLFGISIEEFEQYSINNYNAIQKFSEEHPEIMEKYNELSQLLPTLFEDY